MDAQADLSAAAAEPAQTDAAAAVPLVELQHATAAPSTEEQQGAMGAVHQSEDSSGLGWGCWCADAWGTQLALPAQPVLAPPSAVVKVQPVPASKSSLCRRQLESSDSEFTSKGRCPVSVLAHLRKVRT